MQAIIETGGKQYKVAEGSVIYVEKLGGDAGETIVFDRILAVFHDGKIKAESPVAGVTVQGKVVKQGKNKKVIVYKMRPKKNYRRKQGHRQPYTKIQIEKIVLG